jgi:REP element-mobilizing transposase RayT
MTFWRCYYHFVWTTKYREPLITPAIETVVIQTIRAKSRELGCEILAINAVPDHLHIALALSPAVAAARWAKMVKGASSHTVNSLNPTAPVRFQWQEGYGALTFGAKQIPYVVHYIECQKDHHAEGKTEPYLEQVGNGE